MEARLFLKLSMASLLLLSPLAAAGANGAAAPGYQQISVPGKHVVAMRQIAPQRAQLMKCHPDATKAVACEAANQAVRMEALARAQDEQRLGSAD